LYREAAEAGHPEAKCALARCYLEGKGNADRDPDFDDKVTLLSRVGCGAGRADGGAIADGCARGGTGGQRF
jgi:TPR repeat protein